MTKAKAPSAQAVRLAEALARFWPCMPTAAFEPCVGAIHHYPCPAVQRFRATAFLRYMQAQPRAVRRARVQDYAKRLTRSVR